MVRDRIKQKSNVKRYVGRWMWNLLSYIPLFIRAPIIRRMFFVDTELPANMIFKKAETADEIEQAFMLAYEAYEDRGLVAENEVRLRVTKYHALPTTSILIAKVNDEVIATISIICDSGFGLPMEKLFNIDFLRKSSTRIAEISTLAIKRGHRAQRGKLLLALCKFMNEYCLNILHIDAIVATVHPEVQDFYRCVLLFDDIEGGKIKHYDFVQGAAASAHYLRIGEPFAKKVERVYKNYPKNRNLFRFFQLDQIENFQFPVRKSKFGAYDFTFSPNLLKYFFNQKTRILDKLSVEEKITISNLYIFPEYRAVFGIHNLLKDSAFRETARIYSVCPVRFSYLDSVDEIQDGVVLDVSRTGLRIKINSYKAPKNSNEIILEVQIAPNSLLKLRGQIVWDDSGKGIAGVWLNSFVPKAWQEFMDLLENDLRSLAGEATQKKKIS